MKRALLISMMLLTFFISACDFGGVKTSTDNNDSDLANTDSLIENPRDTSIFSTDTAGLENPYDLLQDTIQGQPNEMVYNGENGLRVEWTVKKNNNPIELNDVVLINYKSRVAAGEQYDSNEEMGTPAPIKTNIGMIVPGYEAGLLQMSVGDVGRILIPSALAYGEDGYGTIIPPNADLIIDIEIVDKIEPIVLEEGVKVYKWKTNKVAPLPEKDQLITFDYFAYTTGEKGRLYDNSFQNSEPFSFKLENDNVVDGLHQGMSVVREEECAFIEIPANLAYGKDGLLDLVPKNTGIVYDIRVLYFD